MARGKMAAKELLTGEKLEQALVPIEEQPYSIPGNWCWVTIGTIASVKGGKRIPKGNQLVEQKTEHPYIRVTDFYNRSIATEQVKYIDEETFNLIHNYTISTQDIYISIAGTIGKVGIIPDDLDGANMTENAAKITNIKGVNKNFLLWLLESEVAQSQMRDSTISTTQPKLALFRIENIKFPLSPLAEQYRIVNIIESLFAKLDEAKEKAQAVVDGFELRKSAILHKAFKGELTERWRKEHGVELDSWKSQALGLITENLDAKRIPLSQEQRANMNRKYNYYGASGVIDKVEKYLFEGRYLLIGEDGANLVTRSKPIAFIADGQYWVNNHAHVLATNSHMIMEFLCYYINSIDLIPYVTGSAQPKLTQKKMNTIPIPVASIQEQEQIVGILDKIFIKERQAKSAAEAVLSQIDTMKKAILACAFRGALGTNDPAEEWAGELVKKV